MSIAFPAHRTLHLVIHGRVQGVFFRDSMRREAAHLRIAGWVRNCRDGSVEALVQGEEPGLDAIVQWAHQGPPSARVTQVDVREAPAEPCDGFEIRYD